MKLLEQHSTLNLISVVRGDCEVKGHFSSDLSDLSDFDGRSLLIGQLLLDYDVTACCSHRSRRSRGSQHKNA